MTTDNFCFYLQNRLIQTSQTGGQGYSDTFPFSTPWLERKTVHFFLLFRGSDFLSSASFLPAAPFLSSSSSSSVDEFEDALKRRIVNFRRCMPAPSFSPDDDEAVSNEVPGSKKIIKLHPLKVPRYKLVRDTDLPVQASDPVKAMIPARIRSFRKGRIINKNQIL
jgi:hypothetical protein